MWLIDAKIKINALCAQAASPRVLGLMVAWEKTLGLRCPFCDLGAWIVGKGRGMLLQLFFQPRFCLKLLKTVTIETSKLIHCNYLFFLVSICFDLIYSLVAISCLFIYLLVCCYISVTQNLCVCSEFSLRCLPLVIFFSTLQSFNISLWLSLWFLFL